MVWTREVTLSCTRDCGGLWAYECCEDWRSWRMEAYTDSLVVKIM